MTDKFSVVGESKQPSDTQINANFWCACALCYYGKQFWKDCASNQFDNKYSCHASQSCTCRHFCQGSPIFKNWVPCVRVRSTVDNPDKQHRYGTQVQNNKWLLWD